jgi:hypothetical protein
VQDAELLARIKADVDEEHVLRSAHDGEHPVTAEDTARLRQLEEHLDQLWDLLRQRRARRDAGEDPDGAETRSTAVVEQYRS